MNEFQAYPRATIQGFVVMLRFAKDGEAKPLLERGEKPRIFPTEKEAWKASTESLVAYLNGSLTSTGHKTTAAKAAAEKLFMIRKGRKIPIEHRKGASA